MLNSDPLISVEVFGKVGSGSDHSSFGQTAVCIVTNLAREANIAFYDARTPNRLNATLYKNQPNFKYGEYHQGILITDISHRRLGFLTCHVVDKFGAYNKTVEIHQTGK